jgi:ABC-type Mn2+/Zn2+ transport system ATPase subunit
MLLMSGVCVKINGADILADVDLGVAPHTLSGLLGRNGAGKTTLMRAVMGALPIAGEALHLMVAPSRRYRHTSAPGLGLAICQRIVGSYQT